MALLFQGVEFMSVHRSYPDLAIALSSDVDQRASAAPLVVELMAAHKSGLVECSKVTVMKLAAAPDGWWPDSAQVLFSLGGT